MLYPLSYGGPSHPSLYAKAADPKSDAPLRRLSSP